MARYSPEGFRREYLCGTEAWEWDDARREMDAEKLERQRRRQRAHIETDMAFELAVNPYALVLRDVL
jgi:hypothetical protein